MYVVGTMEGFALVLESREDVISTLMMLKECLKRPNEAFPAVLMCSNGALPPNEVAATTKILKEGFGHALRTVILRPPPGFDGGKLQ